MREEKIDEGVSITWRDERLGRSVVQSEEELQKLLRHFGVGPQGEVDSQGEGRSIQEPGERSAAPGTPDDAAPPPAPGKYPLMKRPESAEPVENEPDTEIPDTEIYETDEYTIRILKETDPQTVVITRKPVDAVQEAAWRFAEEQMARIERQDGELGVLFLDENVFVPFSKLAYDPQRGFQIL